MILASDSAARLVSSLPLNWLILLGGLVAIGPLSTDMYLPAFPAMARDLGGRPGAMAYTLASYFVGLALGQLFYGPVSDRFGRRRPFLAGLALYVVASLGCALAGSAESLVAWRFLQALGGCSSMVIVRAVVRDRCEAREAAKAFSMLILVMGVTPLLAPLLGGWMGVNLGWLTRAAAPRWPDGGQGVGSMSRRGAPPPGPPSPALKHHSCRRASMGLSPPGSSRRSRRWRPRRRRTAD
jgi:MFS family permease